jgi:serine/threonine-protein kinase
MSLLGRPAAERFASLLDRNTEAPLPDVLVGRYRIEREIGRGGMARVYLAHDIKHARNVAVKVIRPEFAASLGRERFLREIGIAARLRHPNIVPLYDSGDADGVLFFVMPYEEGLSLRSRINESDRLSVAERVSVLRDIARALDYAHAHGVVHRDVKPDNVMLSGGAAVVTDFGIAKAVSEAQTGASGATITQVGAGIGTPAYMAPEQATGDPSTDHRADIYSFGCVAYELFAGKPPFHGVPTHQIITAHVATKPVPLTERCTDVSESLARLIARCLEKNPNDRPQSAKELLTELEGASTTPTEAARRRLSKVALVTSAAIGLTLIAGAAYGVLRRPPASDEWTIAVLPLRSLGGDSLHGEDLATGLSDEIAAALVKVPGIRVKSRGGVSRFRGREVDPQAAGKELGVRFLVMGSLRGTGKGFKVTARLVSAEDGSDLWADVIDRSDGDFTVAREEMVRVIGQTLRARFGSPVDADHRAQKPARSVNPEAYRLYILAQRGLDRRGVSMRPTVDMFRQAIRLDSLFANAYSGLSLALALTPYFEPTPVSEVFDDAIASAEFAQHLDPTLAQPHIALGMIYQTVREWDRAGKELRRAIDLDIHDVEARVQYGRFLLIRDSVPEALAQLRAAQRDDPASALVLGWVSRAYDLVGRLDSALVASDHAFQSDSTNRMMLGYRALARFRAGDTATARQMARRSLPGSLTGLYVLAATGDTAIALDLVRGMERSQPRPWMTESTRAFVMLGLGDTTAALAALERANAAKEGWSSKGPMRDPIFDPIRGSTRFQEILRQLRLPASLGLKAARKSEE